jgi:hypothetical protein
MAAIGGSVESVTINGRELPVTADADINRKLGGYENDVQANGNATARIIKTRVNPSLTGIVTECDDARGDHEFVQALADGDEFVPTAITYADGSVYEGVAIVSGELQHSNQSATLSFDMMGQGTFARQ